MGVDLIGRDNPSFNWASWRSLLEIAVAFGWKPAGTIANPDFQGDWDGSYGTNDFQLVTKDDARFLGLALHLAVAAKNSGMELSEEQAKAAADMNVEFVSKFADYAISGEFVIS